MWFLRHSQHSSYPFEGLPSNVGESLDVYNERNKTYKYMLTYRYTAEPGYNDTGLYDTSLIASDILWYKLIRHC
jgi:hypothetical protein